MKMKYFSPLFFILLIQTYFVIGDEMQSDLLDKQIEYYRVRAGEYDQWFLRTGKYDCGKELNELWFQDVKEVAGELLAFNPHGEVLELACGTGWWTQQLVLYADKITAIDASPEVISINKDWKTIKTKSTIK